jgi:uncharacterized membrane protein YqaE (UPF0057 family)
MKNILFAVVAVMLVLSSCTVEKRRYMDGYHVEWHHRDNNNVKEEKSPVTTEHQNFDTKVDVAQSQEAVVSSIDQDQTALKTEGASRVEEVIQPIKKNKKEKTKTTRQQEKDYSNEKQSEESKMSFRMDRNFEGSRFLGEQESESRIEQIVLVLLAIFLPPVAVYLHEGNWNLRCWISLGLWICGILPGIIFALWVVLR